MECTLEFYGGHSNMLEKGIDKSMLSDFGFNAILKNVELINHEECYANVDIDYKSDRAKEFYNLEKNKYRFKGTINNKFKDINIEDLEKLSQTSEVWFSFPEKKYMTQQKIPISLETLYRKDIIQIRNKYIQAINALFDDVIYNLSDIQETEVNEIKDKFIEQHQVHTWHANDIIKYYGKNISYNISNKKRLINLLESDKSDVD